MIIIRTHLVSLSSHIQVFAISIYLYMDQMLMSMLISADNAPRVRFLSFPSLLPLSRTYIHCFSLSLGDSVA